MLQDVDDPLASMQVPPEIGTMQLGVWRLLFQRPSLPTILLGPSADNIKSDVHIVLRLFKDVYRLGPTHFTFMVLASATRGARDALTIWTTSRLLVAVSHCTSSPPADVYDTS